MIHALVSIPRPRSRPAFSFHRLETLAALIPQRSEDLKDLHGASLAAIQEIVDDLEAALEQFRLISNDLGRHTSEKVT